MTFLKLRNTGKLSAEEKRGHLDNPNDDCRPLHLPSREKIKKTMDNVIIVLKSSKDFHRMAQVCLSAKSKQVRLQ